jgi:two-component system, cell cycle sensor histidine kinase and response regulator CckA
LELEKDTLKDLGYTVLAANTPAIALKLIQEQGVKIHLLITDVVMPGINGKELARQINLVQPEIKCLFMSGYTSDIMADHGMLEEGTLFIQKPFLLKDLADMVRKILEK